ncbi:methionine adenosyltransferase [Marinilabiliaceae bacterium ANBcel2]|nr:methionine adenosyltransferase [Marinilabiliaceae bacterium ANBcel2]
METKHIFTSESVSEGHPDKVADQISDAILDACLTQDPESKVACENLITSQHLTIAGELQTSAVIDAPAIARQVIKEIGYNHINIGFDYKTAEILDLLHQQSPEINFSVSDGGAGDQGIMFGYATDETPEMMPLPVLLSHRLLELHASLRKNGTLSWARPDAKSQVSVIYQNGLPVGIDTVLLSMQHSDDISQEEIRELVAEQLIRPVFSDYRFGKVNRILINPSGSFTVGGPHGDTGLTGRKIVVDTYGGACPHGGGAFSGKDATKVDRSAAYAARYVAKHIVAAGLAKRCTIQLSYAIGVAEPVSVYVDTHATGKLPSGEIEKAIRQHFDLTPGGIIAKLKLMLPVFRETASYGHFGREQFSWEQLDEQILGNL